MEVEDEEEVRRWVGNGMDMAELPGRDVMSQAAEKEEVVEVVLSRESERAMAVEVCLEAGVD
jgi:hypothetical protein